MYLRPQARQTQRTADLAAWPAPTAGLIANRNLALPEGAPGATILENFMPTSGGAIIRRGSELHATVGGGVADVEEGWSYINGNQEEFFVATATTIYDITVPSSPVAVAGGLTSGDWVVTQFATTGGTFLVCVNGHDAMRIYDGQFWMAVSASNQYYLSYDGGRYRLKYDTGTGAFTVGQTVTGLTSLAHGVIKAIEGTMAAGTLVIDALTGSFQDNETLDDPLTGSAKADGIQAGGFTVGQVVTGVTSGSTGAVVSVTGTVAAGTLQLSSVSGTFQDNEVIDDPLNGQALASGTRRLTSNVYILPYDTGTVAFVGGTLTGGTSGATAFLNSLKGTTAAGTLILTNVIGTFLNNEVITSSGGGSALVNGVATLRLSGITGLPGGVTTNIWSYVWVYKNRLFFVEKESLNAWYLAVDSIGGAATVFPLGGVYSLGGSLLFGSSWNIESSDGLDSRCLFITGNETNSIGNEGEIAVYAGIDPSDPNQWGLVGVYRSGMPMGKKAHVRAGGDLIIATDLGFVPVSVALQRDVTQLAASSISSAIEDTWGDEVALRSSSEWKCKTWPSGRMTVVMLPTVADQRAKWFVGNWRTGAWCTFTGWDARCVMVYHDRLFFGSTLGRVIEAMVSGMDEPNTVPFDARVAYTATFVPLFETMRAPGRLKVPTQARAVLRAPVDVNPTIKMLSDLNISLQPPPAATVVPPGDTYGSGVWGDEDNPYSVWGGFAATPTMRQRWVSVGGSGDRLAPALRLTSGAARPLDAELVEIQTLFTVAEVVT